MNCVTLFHLHKPLLTLKKCFQKNYYYIILYIFKYQSLYSTQNLQFDTLGTFSLENATKYKLEEGYPIKVCKCFEKFSLHQLLHEIHFSWIWKFPFKTSKCWVYFRAREIWEVFFCQKFHSHERTQESQFFQYSNEELLTNLLAVNLVVILLKETKNSIHRFCSLFSVTPRSFFNSSPSLLSPICHFLVELHSTTYPHLKCTKVLSAFIIVEFRLIERTQFHCLSWPQ